MAAPTQSPNAYPQGIITTYSPEPGVHAGSRTTGVSISQGPAPTTPTVGLVGNVLPHPLTNPGGFPEHILHDSSFIQFLVMCFVLLPSVHCRLA